MDALQRLMTLIDWLRHPDRKPPLNEHIDARLDAVEHRLRVLSPESARRARRVVRQGR